MKIKDKILDKKRWQHLGKTLRFSLHGLTSPFDAFWDLTHEKRGSVGAATVILVLTLITNVMRARFSNFQFYIVDWNHYNVFMEIGSVLVPFFIYIIGNWCLTTLFDGKGTIRDIYMGTAYALTPYVLIQIPLVFVSNCVTLEEGAFYQYFGAFSLIWCGVLILASVMMIHDFSLGKAMLSIIFSVVAMLVIIFLIILFFSLISDCFAYFYSIYKEVVFRLY